jgi:predicted RecA/RadA family phage recombinase
MADYGPTPTLIPPTITINYDAGPKTASYTNNGSTPITAGTVIIQGSLFGFVISDIRPGQVGALQIMAGITAPITSGTAYAAGLRWYWDNIALVATTSTSNASGPNTPMGINTEAVSSSATDVYITITPAPFAIAGLQTVLPPTYTGVATTALAGTGTVQVGATALSQGVVVLDPTAGNTAYDLPSMVAGEDMTLINASGSVSALIFPPVPATNSAQINGTTANTSLTVPHNTSRLIKCLTPTQFASVPTVPS